MTRASRVDVVFPLLGRTLPRDHRQALADALAAQSPWLAQHDDWGLHRINVAAGDDPAGPALLSSRATAILAILV